MASALHAVASAETPRKKTNVVPVPIERKLSLTLEECAALTGLKICALRSAIWAGDLPYIRMGAGGRYLIRRESLEKFLAAQEQREAQ